MGMDAEVIAIGTVKQLEKYDALTYPKDFYEDVLWNSRVIGHVAFAHTSDQSRRLAELCGTEAWDLGRHRLSEERLPFEEDLGGMVVMMDDYIGDQDEWTVFECVRGLLEDGAELWYIPNG